MSESAINAALRRLGYGSDDMTARGSRSMAATRLNEMGFRADVVECQLAHCEKNDVRDAYNRAEYPLERTQEALDLWQVRSQPESFSDVKSINRTQP